jgi:signal transduction histidine kinase
MVGFQVRPTVVAVVLLTGAPAAADLGTADEARAMLEQAVAALKEDREAALAAFNTGEATFKDRDLYVFCINFEQDVFTAHGANPALVGQTPPELLNAAGESVDAAIREAAMASGDGFAEVQYMWPRPGGTEPVEKAAYMARVDDQICGVGYYR